MADGGRFAAAEGHGGLLLQAFWVVFFYHSYLIVFQLPARHYETVHRSFRYKRPDLASEAEAVRSSARSLSRGKRVRLIRLDPFLVIFQVH